MRGSDVWARVRSWMAYRARGFFARGALGCAGWMVGGRRGMGLWIGGAKAKAKGCGVRTGAIAQKGGCAWEADGRRLGGGVEEAGSAWGVC